MSSSRVSGGSRRQHFEDLPLDAKVRVEKLAEVLPELRDIAVRIYPTQEEDQRRRAAREARERREQEALRAEREAKCRAALDGEFGRDVRKAAQFELDAAGGELMPTVIQKIINIVREHERKQNRRK